LIELLEPQHVRSLLVEVHSAHGIEPLAVLVDQQVLRVPPILALERLCAHCGDELSHGRVQRHVAAVDPCPITHPNGSKPPGPMFGAEPHGNGSIWVGLWSANVVVWSAEPDGSVSAKFGWWRGVAGKLRIDGHRLDGQAPPLTAHVPDGYGDSGFQSTGITFPTEGCWRVTGRVGDASLTFVTLVLAV